MSATSMANVAINRQRQANQPGGRRSSMIAQARAADGETAPDNAFTAAMKVVTTYIPTEVLTLYVAVVATYASGNGSDRAWGIFFGGLIATPLVNVLVFLAKLRTAGSALPANVWEWPVWESIAATIAFVFWAAALPETPFADRSWYDRDLAGLLVGIVATLLGLVSSIIAPAGVESTGAPANPATTGAPANPAPLTGDATG